MGTGVVTAGNKAGTATITATAGGKSASVQVTVTGVPDPYEELDALAKAHASDLADGEYVVSTALKDGLVLEVAGWSKKDGANVDVWTSHGGANQKWKVSHDSKGYVTLSNANSGKDLEVKGWSTRDGANADVWTSHGAAVDVERRPQPEVGRGPGRFVVPPGVRDVRFAGPGSGGLVHEGRRERGAVDVERRRKPAVEVR